MRKAIGVEMKKRKTLKTFDTTYIHSFIRVQSVENFGTRKKRKENIRKAIDVETHNYIPTKCLIPDLSNESAFVGLASMREVHHSEGG